jgi:protein-tyrosine phosphatase
MGLVELHFHLLPGVDDGPSSPEESAALAAAAVADGTRLVVATPHIHPAHITDPGVIASHIRELADHLRRERIGLSVLPGGELAHTMVQRLTQDQLDRIAHGPPGRRWVLMEVPFNGAGADFASAADELRERGFGIVLAHPERSRQTSETVATVARELALGSVPQLTSASVTGVNGETIRTVALTLLRSAPRAVIASDAHGGDRMPALRTALDALTAAGERDVGRFAAEIPRALLERGLAAGPVARAA